MKVFALVLCCVLVAQANVLKSEVQREWERFTVQHKRVYKDAVEREFRFKIFAENLKKIIRHNLEYAAGKETYSMAMNKFGDLLESEVLEKITGLRPKHTKKNLSTPVKTLQSGLPDSMDWREKGAVTPVKDQASCGSCWAFSATGSMEGQNFLKTGTMVSLSEKNLMDCSWKYGNMGCGGGWMDSAFDYVIDNGGIDTEESYPYKAVNGQCQYDESNKGASFTGYVDLPVGDENALKDAVATVGPVSVAINANSGFQFYSGGVFKDSRCSPNALNHGVLAVGYGTENGQDYWLVKNSWGGSWGDNGYIKMARNYNNMCGITEAASYPTM